MRTFSRTMFLLGLIALACGGCGVNSGPGGGTEDDPLPGPMSGLWEIPITGGTLVASITQLGDQITGFGYNTDSSRNGVDNIRLEVNGTVKDRIVKFSAAGGGLRFDIEALLSPDSMYMQWAYSTAPCWPYEDGSPESQWSSGAKIVPLDGSFDVLAEDDGSGAWAGTMKAQFTQSRDLGAIGEIHLSGTITFGSEWPFGPLTLTSEDWFWLHAGKLVGLFRSEAGDELYLCAYRTHTGSDTFKGSLQRQQGSVVPGGSVTFARPRQEPTLPVTDSFIYVGGEDKGGLGVVSAFAIDPATGRITEIPGSPFASRGTPGSLAFDRAGRFAFVGGLNRVTVLTIDPASGALNECLSPPLSAEGDYKVGVDPQGNFVYALDMHGNTISGYAFDSAFGALTEIAGSPFVTGNMSRGITLDPKGRFVYVPGWSSNCIWAYAINLSTGALIPVPGSPFAGAPGPTCISVDPAGRFAYVTNNWGGGTAQAKISVYAIDSVTGGLIEIAGSPFAAALNPEHLLIDAESRFVYVANQYGRTVSAYAIDPAIGALTEVPGSPYSVWLWPSHLAFDPEGGFLYVANSGSKNLSIFRIDNENGGLREIEGSPVFMDDINPRTIATLRIKR